MGPTGVLRHLTVTGILVLIVQNQIVVNAATTGRKPAPISSATSTNNKGRRVMVEAFENAGKTPGLEIWRIEVKFKFVFDFTLFPLSLEITITSDSLSGAPNFMNAQNIFSKTVKEIYLCLKALIVQPNGTRVSQSKIPVCVKQYSVI